LHVKVFITLINDSLLKHNIETPPLQTFLSKILNHSISPSSCSYKIIVHHHYLQM